MRIVYPEKSAIGVDIGGTKIKTGLVDINGRIVGISSTGPLDINKGIILECNNLPTLHDYPLRRKIKLTLEDSSGNLISENLYWRYSQHQNFYWLMNMPKVTLKQDLKLQKQEKEYQITLSLTNNSDKLSFFNHLMIQRENTKEVVNPVFWSDNFISLFPNETRTITATVSIEDLHGEKPIIIIK
mgnify:CR=1 FL=1